MLTACLVGGSMILMASFSTSMAYLYGFILLFVTFVAPGILIWAQVFKKCVSPSLMTIVFAKFRIIFLYLLAYCCCLIFKRVERKLGSRRSESKPGSELNQRCQSTAETNTMITRGLEVAFASSKHHRFEVKEEHASCSRGVVILRFRSSRRGCLSHRG